MPRTSGCNKMENILSSRDDFEWFGKGDMLDGKLHFKMCRIGSATVSVNDYVQVNTRSNKKHNTAFGKVVRLFDLGDHPDPFRAEIHWLYKYEDLTKKCRDNFKEQENELFLPVSLPDERPIRGSIQIVDAETILHPIKVSFLDSKKHSPLVKKYKERSFYVKYAFDGKDNIYHATEYLSRLKSVLKVCTKDANNNNNCRTPSHLTTPNNIIKSHPGDKQWRVGTPKTRSSTSSPGLNGLRLVLKVVKMDSCNTPVKRKASKSIPDDKEVEKKRSKNKIKSKQNENLGSQKELESVQQTFATDQVLDIMSDDYDDDNDEDKGSSGDDDVFVGEKKSESVVKTPTCKTREPQNDKISKTATPSGRVLRSQTPLHVVNNKDLRTPSQTPRRVQSRSKSTTRKSNKTKTTPLSKTLTTPPKTPGIRALSKLTKGIQDSKTPGKTPRNSISKKNLAKVLTPSIPSRSHPCKTPRTPLQEARTRLHVSAVPTSLPCRDNEFADILGFVEGRLTEGCGGCMYISGVPGTGKTATVHEVIRVLQEANDANIPDFRFIELNGMKLTEPSQTYSMFLKKLTGQKATPTHASELLEKMFSKQDSKKESVVLMVDELDLLWTRKQGVMYNLFEWPTRRHSKLIVLAIANTMDLPERMMINRVQSRLGLTRITFQPYTYSQLQEIVLSRIQNLNVFDPDAMQLVSRKVAAVSGDARRCLDICRRAVEITEQENKTKKSKKEKLVGMAEVNTALQDMFSSPKIKLMMNLSSSEIMMLKAVLAEFKRTGVEETVFGNVFEELCNQCRIEGINPPSMTDASAIVSRIGASRLLLVEMGRLDLQRRISLNVNQDDVIYALRHHPSKK